MAKEVEEELAAWAREVKLRKREETTLRFFLLSTKRNARRRNPKRKRPHNGQ